MTRAGVMRKRWKLPFIARFNSSKQAVASVPLQHAVLERTQASHAAVRTLVSEPTGTLSSADETTGDAAATAARPAATSCPVVSNHRNAQTLRLAYW